MGFKRAEQRRALREMHKKSIQLTKEQWHTIANELLDAGPLLKAALQDADKNYPDGTEVAKVHPALDPETFETDIRLACTAIAYVAEFATDKCRLYIDKEEKTND